MFVTRFGEGVSAAAPGRWKWAAAEVARARDAHMLAMRRGEVPVAVIAEYFNVAPSTVRRRLAALPAREEAGDDENS